MRYRNIFVLILFFIACNEKTTTETNTDHKEIDSSQIKEIVYSDSINLNDPIVIDDQEEVLRSLKREKLIVLKDDRSQLQELIISKGYFKEEDQYVLDFTYPLLNEVIDPGYRSFNDYINLHYVDIKGTEAQILEDKEMFCDTLRTNNYKEKRKVDFKVYYTKDNVLSILFFRENYYSGAMHSSYIFDCINYDLEEYSFMNYDDFFMENSEEEIFSNINNIIMKGISTGDLYFDCWELSLEDFNEYKDNFVIDDKYLEFYFDDCVICPSYTGTFSVEIPIEIINNLLNGNQL